MSETKIAIVGAACRFPGAPDLPAFERLLFEGRQAVTEIPEARWSKAFFHDEDLRQPGKSYTFAAGVLEHIDRFDAGFFGVSPREAAHIDPQQRLALELAYEATEDAGLPLSRLAGGDGGVFIGASSFDYLTQRAGDVSIMDAHSMQGLALSSISNRISYVFDLKGPSFTVDTACSSSMVALHLACEALRRGESPLALAGGVNLLIAPQGFIGFSRAGMLSPKGRCHAFDSRADGYVRAEGGAVLVLKPLEAALADGDRIRGVIRATGVNSDGRTTGLSLPSREGQAKLLREVYARAEVAPDDLSYLEAHGTGTPVGDPIEAGAIADALSSLRVETLPIGSAKTNIGHLEAASGMAGVLKALFALERGEAPPTLNLETPNPNIPFEAHKLQLARDLTPLKAGPQGRIAGVNSFGFGGTNAHAVLQQAPDPAVADPDDGRLPPLLISARDEDALRALAEAWAAILKQNRPLSQTAALLRGAARRRTQHPHRLAAWGAAVEELAQDLDAWLAGEATVALTTGQAVDGKVGFVFSGNGSQWAGMGQVAYAQNPIFRAAVDQVDALLTPQTGWSVSERLRNGLSAADLADTTVAQPALFAVQVGAVQALLSLGVSAEAFAGHSVGEVAAAWASGALTLPQACQVVAHRSRLQGQTRGRGGMAAVGVAAEVARELIADAAPELAIAAVNSPSSVTVSGPDAALRTLEPLVRSRRWLFARLDLDYAFHSAAMDPIRAELRESLALIRSRAPEGLLVSTVTGRPGEALDADYWWRNIREPVLFAPAIEAMRLAGVRLFLEIGPQPILQGYVRECLRQAHAPGRAVGALGKSDRPGADPFLAIAARAYCAGADITGAELFEGSAAIDGLPAYPWSRQPHWVERTSEGVELNSLEGEHALLGFQRRAGEPVWFNHLSVGRQPWLADHQVDGAVVLPAAGMVEMAFAAARAQHPDARTLELFDIEISRPVLLDGGAREVRFTLTGSNGGFVIESRPRLTDDTMTAHAKGRSAPGAGAAPLLQVEPPTAAEKTLGPDAFYERTRRMRLQYGPAFQTVARASVRGASFVEVEFAPPEPGALTDPLLDPTVLDGALQGLAALFDADGGEATALPWRFGRIRLLQPGVRPAGARIQVRARGPRAIAADLLLLDGQGQTVVELTDCWFVGVDMRRGGAERERRFGTVLIPTLEQPARVASKGLADRMAAAVSPVETPSTTAMLGEAFALSAMQEALLAVIGDSERSFAPSLLAFEGRVATASLTILERIVAALEAEGVLTRVGEAWRFEPAAALPPSTDIWRSLLDEAPAAVAELASAASRAAALAEVLRRGPEAWPTAPLELGRQMLFGSPTARIAVGALEAAVLAGTASTPDGGPLRLAVVGALAPEMLSGLLSRVRRAGGAALRTTILTVSDEEAATLSPVLADFPGVAAEPWSARREGCYDLVAGVYALRGPDARDAAELDRLLVPDGVLLSIEPSPSLFWSFSAAGGALDGFERLAPDPGLADANVVPLGGEVWSVELRLARRSVAAAGGVEAGTGSTVVLFAAPDDDLAPAAAFALAEKGRAPSSRPLEALGELDEPSDEPRDLIVFAPPVRDRVDALTDLLARLAAALPALSAAGSSRLWLVSADPLASEVLEALRRVTVNEAPEVDCRMVALDPALRPTRAVERLLAELRSTSKEASVVHTAAGRFAPRLRTGAFAPEAALQGPRKLDVDRPGLLSSLTWKPFQPASPGPGEVAIAVRAAGLNFRDVMWAAGLLPDEALLHGFAGPGFGLECAGVVAAVGEGVDDLRVGQRVVAVSPAALATRAVTQRHAVLTIPDEVSFEGAATLPVAFLTAVYGLGRLARLEKGERVLIHGGAGGVGLAAIQYAQHLGAEVFATAGSPVKRELLARLGVAHVFDSRSAAFADDVLRATGGEGVDVVLNSLSDELMQQSLRLLRPFGRFVEIGKRDLFGDTAVGLRPLRHNASYFAVDVDQLASLKPIVAQALFTEIETLLADGVLRPLPHRAFGFEQVTDAFRLMQGSGHIGKIVLTPEPVQAEARPAAAPFKVRDDGVYLVTGGLGGLGLESARWLARQGARRLALVSRRGEADPGAAQVLAEFKAKGVEAQALACDVADASALAETLVKVRAAGPLLGVVHAAAVIEDGLLPSLDRERLERVLRPKAQGALNLDALTRTDPLELFVLYSSISNAIGNPGQGAYVAANAVLEGLAARRRGEGRPATAVRWGPIADVGYLSREDRVKELLDAVLGGGELTARAALDALPGLIAADTAAPGYAEVDWSVLRRQLPIGAGPLFSEMPIANAIDAGAGALRDRLAGLTEDEAQAVVLEVLVEETAAILRLPRGRIDVQQPLADIGCDSLMAVELRLAIEARLGGELPLLSVSDGASLDSLALRIVRTVRGGTTESAALADQVARYEGAEQAAALTQAAE